MTNTSFERPRCWTVDDYDELRRKIFYPKTDLMAPDETLRAIKSRSAEELGITNEILARVGAHWLGEKPTVAPLAEQGTFHRLFRLTLPDGRRFVMRINAANNLYRDFSMYQDLWLSERMGHVGAPRVRAVDISYSRRQFEYEIFDEARGESLTRLDDSDAILGPLRLLGAAAARIHLQRFRGFGWFTLRPLHWAREVADVALRGSDARWGDYLERNFERHANVCRRIGAITGEEQRRILALFTQHARLWDDAPSALLHGDLGNHNVFTDGQRITAIIDWEDCLVGDPVYDIAFWATFHPEPRHAVFLEGYRQVVELPADFWLRFWLYFLRVSLAKTVHRHRFGYEDRPGRPPAARRIQLSLERLESAL
jgi:Ser/Thr protein kinase RdoA (MazF antagonist)